MNKSNNQPSKANKQRKVQKIHQIWSSPIITNLINTTSGRVDILTEDKIKPLRQEEIDTLDNNFIQTVLDYKDQMIKLINRKINTLDANSPIIKKMDEFTYGIINKVKGYESDYAIWDILIQLPIIKGKKYGDFPKPNSAIDFLRDIIQELEQMPDILDNPEKNRPKIKEKYNSLRERAINTATKKLGRRSAGLWRQVIKFEKYCNEIKLKFGEEITKYYAWHALIGSTPRKGGPQKYIDLVGENSIENFYNGCVEELESMSSEDVELIKKKVNILIKIRIPNFSKNEVKELEELMLKMPEFNTGKIIELYKQIATLRNNLSNMSKYILGDIGGMYWWYNKTNEYFTRIQNKYPNLSEYIVGSFVIGSTPTEGEIKYVDDLLKPDSVIEFFDDCKNELINMEKKQVDYYNGFTAETIKSLHLK